MLASKINGKGFKPTKKKVSPITNVISIVNTGPWTCTMLYLYLKYIKGILYRIIQQKCNKYWDFLSYRFSGFTEYSSRHT